jgi:hypothetical protein
MQNRLRATAALAVLFSAVGCSSAAPKGSASEEGGFASLDNVPSTSATDCLNACTSHAIKNVFVIVLENHAWAAIKGNPSAPYINGTLLAQGAHADAYSSPRDLHPSEPNYVWLEAGDNLAILDDDDPSANFRTTKVHLTTQLDTAQISWKSYQEGIGGDECPLVTSGLYAPKHNPMVFFDDVTDGRNPKSAHCIAHIRPYEELATDLAAGTVPKYSWITPNLCDDMHNSGGCPSGDEVANGDAWLAREVPKIMASKAYKDGGAIFITWDENEGDGNTIGLIVMSPFAKPGYANTIAYTHSSLLRSVQDVFALQPYMRNAVSATGLEDLFTRFP